MKTNTPAPGPWSYDADHVIYADLDPDRGIAIVAASDHFSETAHARLIAAAPELLLALTRITEAILRGRKQTADDMAHAVHMIQKATGTGSLDEAMHALAETYLEPTEDERRD